MDKFNQFVRFRAVTKSYDGKTSIVSNLDLDIAEGEFLTLLGPSGSGKTTCLMMLAGFEEASGGTIFIDGQKVNDTPAYKRNIGMVFQSYALFPHMTITDNVGFPLKQRKVSRGETQERVRRALETVRLEGLGSRYPAQLSGGQQQRVALARALIFEPRLILMDEPLGALDRRLREHMQIEIKQLHERIGTTIVYVTHDQSEALTMSDRIAVFNKGHIEQIGTPEEVYERPATSFVAHFMGENNSLSGVVKAIDHDGLCRVILGSGETVQVTMVDPLGQGDQVEIAVRPERFVLEPIANVGNGIEVEVVDIIYNGDHLLLPCKMKHGAAVQMKLPVTAPESATVAKGARLYASWKIQDGRAFKA